MSQIVEPIQGPVLDEPLAPGAVEAPRLARHQITLADGHQVGVTIAGKGVPLVVVHGFSVEGFLYAQSLSRLVNMGFRVIAIDTAGHGATQGLPLSGQNLNEYAALLGRVIDDLGIEHYLLAGHSMGGQLVTRLAATRPEQVLGVVLIDAIVGDTWDRMVYLFRVAPPLLSAVGTALMIDSAMVVPAFTDPRQATKLLRLVVPTLFSHVTHPWRLLGPTASILRTRSSRYALDEMAANGVPLFALHGTRDIGVPVQTSKDAVRRTDGVLVEVHGAGHSWPLRDPETLPAIVGELMSAELGTAIRDGLRAAGLTSTTPTLDDVEAVCYATNARVFSLQPATGRRTVVGRHRRPKYRWTTTR